MPQLEAEAVRARSRLVDSLFGFAPQAYLLCLGLLIATMLVVPLALLRTSIYPRLSTAFMDAKIDYPYSVKAHYYDIVLYGDSSSMFGIDPLIVSRKLGVSAINLSQTSGVLRVENERPLDAFLAANPKPKLLVLAVNPESVSVDQDSPEEMAIDGWYAMLRRRSLTEAERIFFQHPRMLFALWSNSVYEEFLTGGFLHHTYQSNWQDMTAHNGFYHYPITTPLRSCAAIPADDPSRIHQHSYVDRFRAKYSSEGLKVAVFYTPVADCNPNLSTFQHQLAGTAINEPFAIPHSLMADDYQTNHPLPEGVSLVSQTFSEEIAPALKLR